MGGGDREGGGGQSVDGISDRDHPATLNKSRLLTPLKQELRERKDVEEEG